MTGAIDALTSPTLKHLRERWWNDEFTAFIADTLQPRSGNRILDVGCGEGLAEISLRRLRIPQLQLVGMDLVPGKLAEAAQAVAGHNYRASFVAGDACGLPFRDRVFDAVFCVAVLQHVFDLESAVRECARVTREDGRIVAVEPDNSARYFHSSIPSGRHAFATARELFGGVVAARGDGGTPLVGPMLPSLFVEHGIEPLDVRLFPVSHVWTAMPGDDVWQERREVVERLVRQVSGSGVRALGDAHLAALAKYEADARAAGAAFVEIQHTMLFATVGSAS
jgi:SAM-dependent methyltransferase